MTWVVVGVFGAIGAIAVVVAWPFVSEFVDADEAKRDQRDLEERRYRRWGR